MTIGILVPKGWIRWVGLAVLLPALSWAEPPTSSSLAGTGASSDVRVGLAKDMEAIAGRTLARADESRAGETAGRATLRPEEGFRAGTWHVGFMAGFSIPHKIF
ncbi:MAG: hypothetical protein HYY12_01655, partial [Candidatus Methylomirabilis oxyfera]|nr:hypothetical protein [Candidatus Methylomirabilis oxyfera]